ncbi:MAG: hypothetical protein EXR75_10605 [Myxococcales bacterium]|nr:hypothetical protein [Myxococcales bacterium]
MPIVIASRRVVVPSGDTDAAASEHALRVVPACVVVEGAQIVAVHELGDGDYASAVRAAVEGAKNAAVPEIAANCELYDFGDKLVAPAFVNAHTHLALGFLRGMDMAEVARGNMVEELYFRVERALSPEDVRAFVRMGAYDSLLAGVGLVWDHYYRGRHVAEGMADAGLAGVVAPTLQDLAGPGMDAWEEGLAATASIDDDARLRARGIVAAVGPHATDTVSESLFTRAVELAAQRNLPLHGHLAQSIEEYERAIERHGVSPTLWLERLGVLERAPASVFAHCLFVNDEELAVLARHRAAAIYCPYSQLIFGFPARSGAFSAAGLRWAVATDCASSNDTMNVQQELRYVAGQRAAGVAFTEAHARMMRGGGLEAARAVWRERVELYAAHDRDASAEALLARVWSVPGALHPKLRAGVLASGALANVMVVDLEHPAMWPARTPLGVMAMADPAPAIWALLVAGRFVAEPGNHHAGVRNSLEYKDALSEAKARLARLRVP